MFDLILSKERKLVEVHQELRSWNKSAQQLKKEHLNTDMVVKKKRLSVQENINNKGQTLLGEVDYAIDTWDVQSFDMYKYLTEQKASSAVASSIVNEWDPMIDELKEAKTGECKQLKEGYSHLTKGELDNFYNFVLKLKSNCVLVPELIYNHELCLFSVPLSVVLFGETIKSLMLSLFTSI